MNVFYAVRVAESDVQENKFQIGCSHSNPVLSLAVYITLSMSFLHRFFICKIRRLIYWPQRVTAELNELMYTEILE